MIDLDLFRSHKHWKIKAFDKYTKNMSFEEGHEFCNELVKTIIASKAKLAKYDIDFFRKLGYDAQGNKIKNTTSLHLYDWNFQIKNIINFNVSKKEWSCIEEYSTSIYDHIAPGGRPELNIPLRIINNKKYPEKFKAQVKTKTDAKLLIYKLKMFFRTEGSSIKRLSPENLAQRINNIINTGYTESYIVWLLKNQTEDEINELKNRQKNK